ncbi:MAG TPA: serine/threonine-protein kinase [Solirubrobacteraceae bacterium]
MGHRRKADGGLAKLERRRTPIAFVAIAAVAGTCGTAIELSGAFGSVERGLVSTRFALRPNQPPPSDIVLVTVDRQYVLKHSYVGQVPPRDVLARAVDILKADGAKIIVLDFDLSAGSQPPADLALASAIQQAGNVVYGFADVQASGPHAGDFLMFGSQWGTSLAPRLNLTSGSDLNTEPIADVPFTVAYGTTPPRVWPGLAEAAVARLRGRPVPHASFADGAWVDYYGPPGTVPHVRFPDLLAGRTSAAEFAGKVVLVGVDNPLIDQHSTLESSTNRMAGVEVLANEVGTVLRGFPLRSTSPLQDALWIFLLAALFPLVAWRRGVRPAVAVTSLAAVAYAVFAQLDFDAGHILPLAGPAVGLLGSAGLTIAEHFHRVSGDRQRLRRLFAAIDPLVVGSVLRDGGTREPMIAPTAVIAGYRLDSRLAVGGMGAVYRANQLALNRTVALKLIRPEYAEDDSYRERFVRESIAAASIEHPNVIPIYEAGDAEGILFIAMRYVDGSDLESRLRRDGPLDAESAVAAVCQLAAAVQAAHDKGLVHRDIKPANALLTLDEPPHVYLTDFGVARLGQDLTGTADGKIVGSAGYMAPEQILGGTLTPAADVYALGGLLFAVLTGQAPYTRESSMATMWAHVHADPPRPTDHATGLPPAFDAVVARAMAKDQADRFASAHDFADALRAALRDESVVR